MTAAPHSDARFRWPLLASLDRMEVGVVVGRPLNGRFAWVSDAACRIFGRDRDELLRFNADDLMRPVEREMAYQRARASRGPDSAPRIWRISRPDGSVRFIEVVASPLKHGEMLALLEDVTERVATRLVVEESEKRLAEAQEIAHIGSWEWDVKADAITWSPEFRRIMGVAAAPSGIAAGLDLLHEDDRPAVEDVIRTASDRGEPFRFEARFVRSDGAVRVLDCRGRVAKEGDKVVRMVGTAQDITERKALETFRERFVADAAHELRTPLTAVIGVARTLAERRKAMSEEDLSFAIEALNRQADRLYTLTENLLDLAQFDRAQIAPTLGRVRLAEAIRTAVGDLGVPSRVRLVVDVDGDPCGVADPVRLNQALTNLLANAYRYGGPHITLEARETEDRVLVAVSDDGPGVPEGLVERVFEPFARGGDAAGVAPGSGLGLSIARMLVEAFGGGLWYERRNPHGARFVMRLRRAS